MSRFASIALPLVLSATLSVGSVWAAELKTVDEVVAKYDEARGGAKAWGEVKNLRISGRMKMGPMDLPFQLEMARPNKMRMEMTMQGMTMIQVFDGTNGWQVMPMLGKTDPEPVAGDELQQLKSQADIDGSLIDYAKKGSKAELLGLEDIEGTQAYAVKLVKADGSEETQYIDAEHFLPIKAKSKMKMQGQDVESNATIGDYKDVDGKIMPHSLINEITSAMGPMKQEMSFEKVEFNVAIDDAHFGKPAAAAPAAAPAPAAAEEADDEDGE